MSYNLQAIVFRNEIPKLRITQPKLIALSQGITMLPLTEKLLEQLSIPVWYIDDDDQEYIPPPDELVTFCSELPVKSRFAYIGAEFFGGEGTQSHLLFEGGKQICSPKIAKGAINEALRFLGVEKNAAYDEFDALELGRVRNTEDWLNLGLS